MYYKRVTEYVSTINERGCIINKRYAVIMTEVNIFNGKDDVRIPSYGIEITEQAIASDGLAERWEDRVINISPYLDKVDEIVRYLKQMDLSPLHLCEVVDDMYYDYIEDFDKFIERCKIAI